MILIFVCAYMFLLWIFMVLVRKKRYSAITYAFWGIYFPLFLYELNWSSLIDDSECMKFNYIFIVTAFLLSIYGYRSSKIPDPQLDGMHIQITKFGKHFYILINLGYVFLYLLENYLGSGSVFPGLQQIDIHTYSAPIISYFTNSQFLVLAFDYYYYKATKKKGALLFIALCILMPVITRMARMSVVMSIVQLGGLVLFIELKGNGKYIRKRLKEKRRQKRIKYGILALAGIGFIALSAYTQYRMGIHGAEYTYLEGIGYSGPSWLSWFGVFYGYFPMSFNNLKINLLYREVPHNFIGLYSFTSFYFGILQLDNLLGINTTGQLVGRHITNGLATVPTAFWDFYYDFDYLFFIPVIVALIITYRFEVKSTREIKYLNYKTLYIWYVTYWFFTSFQNTLFLAPAIITGILISFIIRHSFYVEYELYQ